MVIKKQLQHLEYGDITIEDLERNNIEFIKHKKDM